MSKQKIILDPSQFPTAAQYIALCDEIKRLEKARDGLKAEILATLSPVYNPEYIFEAGRLSFASRQVTEVDQMAAYKAFCNAKLRDKLFPTALQFKAGKDKDTGLEHGILTVSWSDPVIATKASA